MAITERFSIFVIVCITALTETNGVVVSAQQPTPWRDPSPHKVQFINSFLSNEEDVLNELRAFLSRLR
jgi:hypothetical protein